MRSLFNVPARVRVTPLKKMPTSASKTALPLSTTVEQQRIFKRDRDLGHGARPKPVSPLFTSNPLTNAGTFKPVNKQQKRPKINVSPVTSTLTSKDKPNAERVAKRKKVEMSDEATDEESLFVSPRLNRTDMKRDHCNRSLAASMKEPTNPSPSSAINARLGSPSSSPPQLLDNQRRVSARLQISSQRHEQDKKSKAQELETALSGLPPDSTSSPPSSPFRPVSKPTAEEKRKAAAERESDHRQRNQIPMRGIGIERSPNQCDTEMLMAQNEDVDMSYSTSSPSSLLVEEQTSMNLKHPPVASSGFTLENCTRESSHEDAAFPLVADNIETNTIFSTSESLEQMHMHTQTTRLPSRTHNRTKLEAQISANNMALLEQATMVAEARTMIAVAQSVLAKAVAAEFRLRQEGNHLRLQLEELRL